MPGARDYLDQSTRNPARSARPDVSPGLAERPAITMAADPRLADSSSSAHADLMHVQRTAGNAALASLVAPASLEAPAVQREVSIDEMTSEVSAPPDAGANEGATADATSPATDAAAAGGEADHTITAGHIGLNAPMVEAPGVIRAQTVIADAIVASSYTPGAGNQW